MTLLSLCVVLAAAPAKEAGPRVQVLNAVLRAPTTAAAVGRVSDLTVTLGAWRSATVVAFTHENPAFRVDAQLDLADEGTFVEVTVPEPVTLAGTGSWTVVLTPAAKAALVGRAPGGWRLGFPEAPGGPVRLATLPTAPPVARLLKEGARLECLAAPLRAAPRGDAARWAPDLGRWTVSRAGPAAGGWLPLQAEAAGVVVLATAPVSATRCEVSAPGGLGLSGSGGASDGQVRAREAMLPAGTRFFAEPGDERPVAELRGPARGLQEEDGRWRVPVVQHGQASLSLHSVVVKPAPTVRLGPLQAVGVGSAFSPRDDWPRLAAPAE